MNATCGNGECRDALRLEDGFWVSNVDGSVDCTETEPMACPMHAPGTWCPECVNSDSGVISGPHQPCRVSA